MSNLDAQIRTFLKVARLGSFRRASEELFVTQAAVTTRIKTLEQWLGFDVFNRHRRGVDLTPQGIRFLEYARNAVEMLEHGRNESRRAESYRAHFRFMCQYLLLEGFALDWVDWMKDHAADVSIKIDSSPSLTAASEIANGQLDLALGYQYKVVKGVVFEPLFNEKLILVTSFKNTRQWRENYIPISWDDQFDDDQRKFMGNLKDSYRISADFIDLARAMLLRQPGSAYVVKRTARELIEQGVLKRVPKTPQFERAAYALYPSSPTHPEVLNTALEGIRMVASQIVKTGSAK